MNADPAGRLPGDVDLRDVLGALELAANVLDDQVDELQDLLDHLYLLQDHLDELERDPVV
jgi:hypothetical protein